MNTGASGIAFIGSVFAPTGYGTAARSYVHALYTASVNLSVINRNQNGCQLVPDPLASSLLHRNINPELFLLHAEPNSITAMKDVFSRTILLTTWEGNILLPQTVEGLNKLREVWVPCRYNLETFRRQVKTPVYLLPHPVHEFSFPPVDRSVINHRLGLRESDYVFLSVASWQGRKNLPLVIEAFVRAFSDDSSVKLVIKTSFFFTSKEDVLAKITQAIQRAQPAKTFAAEEHIRVFDRMWPEESVEALEQRADCYVSLHSSEGWCYPLFDAACNGTPVIATGYSGPMDYLDSRHHHLVRYELTHVDQTKQPDYFPFSSEMVWAAPDPFHAAALMREVYDNREQAAQKAKAGASELREKYSLNAVGGLAKDLLAASSQRAESKRLASGSLARASVSSARYAEE